MKTTFDNYLFRCSGLGRLMTNDRSGKGMGDTCRSYLLEIYREVKWGLKKNIQSKYIEKGLAVEDTSFAFYSEYKEAFYTKNEERFKNDFITGTPDHVTPLFDLKNSWDAFTFPSKETKLNKDYEWQLLGYMWLTGQQNSNLVYLLINTPEQLIQDELRRLNWKLGGIDDTSAIYMEACEELRKQMTFDHIPLNERVLEFDVPFAEEKIEQIKARVIEAREYLNTYEKENPFTIS